VQINRKIMNLFSNLQKSDGHDKHKYAGAIGKYCSCHGKQSKRAGKDGENAYHHKPNSTCGWGGPS
jgi:hypothetical protein